MIHPEPPISLQCISLTDSNPALRISATVIAPLSEPHTDANLVLPKRRNTPSVHDFIPYNRSADTPRNKLSTSISPVPLIALFPIFPFAKHDAHMLSLPFTLLIPFRKQFFVYGVLRLRFGQSLICQHPWVKLEVWVTQHDIPVK